MRHITALVLGGSVLVLAGCGAPQSEKVTGPSKTYTMEQFLKTISIGGTSFSPDETRLLVSSNETGVFNVYELDLASGARTPVTQGDETTFAVAYLPRDDRILFDRDQGGNEVDHLFVRELDGTVRDLTEGEQTKEQFAGFAPRSGELLHREQRPRPALLRPLRVGRGQPREADDLPQRDRAPAGRVSPGPAFVALQQTQHHQRPDIYLVDLDQGGEPQLISAHEGEAAFTVQDFSPDGRWLYYTSNADGEFAALKRYDLAEKVHEDVFATGWDVDFAYFSRLGHYRVIGTNEDGYTKVSITRTATGEPVEVTEPAGGHHQPDRVLALGAADEALGVERHHARQHVPVRPRDRLAHQAHRHPQPRDRPRRPGRERGRPLRRPRRHGDPGTAVQAARRRPRPQGPGHALDPRRSRRSEPARLLGGAAVPHQPRVRRVRGQQPGQLRLRQDLPRRGRPDATAASRCGTASTPRSSSRRRTGSTPTGSGSWAAPTAAT